MCCGSGRRAIRKQNIERPVGSKRSQAQAVRKQSASTGNQHRQVIASRQHVSAGQKCNKCGYLAMTVNIAGRERLQCSNPNCKVIIK